MTSCKVFRSLADSAPVVWETKRCYQTVNIKRRKNDGNHSNPLLVYVFKNLFLAKTPL